MESSRVRVSYQRNPNFLERIGSSLAGILVGLVLLLISSGLLFWNEGRAVQTAKSLQEGLQMVLLLPYSEIVSMENNGKLIHLVGELNTDKVLSDAEYNIVARVVKLRRVVEMYQWEERETERKYDEGNGQTRVEKSYSYNHIWSSHVIRSQGFDDAFNHRNPTEMAVSPKSYETKDVNVGQFLLSEGLISKIDNYVQLPVDQLHQFVDKNVRVFDGKFYHGLDPLHPQIGDLQVKFEYAGISGQSLLGPPTVVSIIARQLGSKLVPYQTEAGDQLELLYIGRLSAEEMFGKEKLQNTMLTWTLRGCGWLVMFIGFTCITSIIPTLVGWLPIIRDIVTLGVCLMNFSLAGSLSLTIIAVGWIFYRPFLGLSLLAMAATPFVMSRMRKTRSRQD